MGFRIDFQSSIDLPEEDLRPRITRKASEIRSISSRMSTTYETQRRLKLDHAATLQQLRFEVNDLRDEICMATQNSHVGTEQCREALLAATKKLTKAITELESL